MRGSSGKPNNSLKIDPSRTPVMSAKQQLLHRPTPLNVVELLHPGSFVTIENHPSDLPPFQVIECRGGLCTVRQQAWGQHVQWEVEHRRLRSA